MLSWIYLVLFAVQVFLLIRNCRRQTGLGRLTVMNLVSLILSVFLLWYYDTLPGYGMMPGFAYFPEVFASLCASVAFAVLMLVTFLFWLFRKRK